MSSHLANYCDIHRTCTFKEMACNDYYLVCFCFVCRYFVSWSQSWLCLWIALFDCTFCFLSRLFNQCFLFRGRVRKVESYQEVFRSRLSKTDI